MTTPTHADDCERILRILMDAPPGGLSMEEILLATSQKGGEPWSFRTINGLLSDLSSQVEHAKVRVKSKNVIKYSIKNRS